jgi:serine/threonine protein kinase
LSVKQLQNYGRQVLEVLANLHNLKWFHIHLHSGNVLIDNDDLVKITELENFAMNMPIKNELYFNYVYNSFNNDNTSVLTEIFQTNYNVYEKIDIVSFGRLFYEMTFGKELKAPFPDDLEYNDLDKDIAEILQAIFPKQNKTYIVGLPEVSASDLIKYKFFEEVVTKTEIQSKKILR